MIYCSTKYIPAHADVTNPYYNHSYGRTVREVRCASCLKVIGEQVKYEMFNKFTFEQADEREKDDYKYCPYCGHEFKR